MVISDLIIDCGLSSDPAAHTDEWRKRMNTDFLDLADRVLDRQVIDANHYLCGKIDDIELDNENDLVIAAILVGNGPASDRLPELGKYLSRKLFGSRVVRIPWNEVEVITDEIKLRSTAAELG